MEVKETFFTAQLNNSNLIFGVGSRENLISSSGVNTCTRVIDVHQLFDYQQ